MSAYVSIPPLSHIPRANSLKCVLFLTATPLLGSNPRSFNSSSSVQTVHQRVWRIKSPSCRRALYPTIATPRATAAQPAQVETGKQPSKQSGSLPKFSARLAQSSLSALAQYYATLCRTQPFIATRLVFSLLSIIASKIIGITVPFLFKRIIDALMQHSTNPSPQTLHLAFTAILLHGAARLLASVSHELRSCVFAKAGQRVGRSITAASFVHLHSLEMAFHNTARTGAITRVVDRGTRSVLTIFRGLIFAFMPTLFELLLVCGVLVARFSIWYVSVVLVTFALFIWWTLLVNDKLGKVRMKMNSVENDASAKLTDSLLNAEAVKSFDNAEYELQRYDKVLLKYEQKAIENEWYYAALNVGQGFIYTAGLTLVLLRAAQGVAAGTTTVGSVVMLATMLQQLWVPLNFLGWQYREVKQSLIDMQNLFDVLKRPTRIVDAPDATDIKINGGEIVFDNVTFVYPEPDESLRFTRKLQEEKREENGSIPSTNHRRVALDRVSFRVPPGKSLALVGSSGSGKSTATRLLTRLYDLTSGRILLDGQDISKASMESLRRVVGTVPQVSQTP